MGNKQGKFAATRVVEVPGSIILNVELGGEGTITEPGAPIYVLENQGVQRAFIGKLQVSAKNDKSIQLVSGRLFVLNGNNVYEIRNGKRTRVAKNVAELTTSGLVLVMLKKGRKSYITLHTGSRAFTPVIYDSMIGLVSATAAGVFMLYYTIAGDLTVMRDNRILCVISKVSRYECSPDNKRVLCEGDHQRLIDLESGEEVVSLTQDNNATLSWCGNNRIVASEDNRALVVNLLTGKECVIPTPYPCQISISNDSIWVYCIGNRKVKRYYFNNSGYKVMVCQTGKILSCIEGGEYPIFASSQSIFTWCE